MSTSATTPDPECLNCGHTFALHTDGYFCYALADGTASPVLTRHTCRCGYWNPPTEPEVPAEPTEPEPGEPEDNPTPETGESDA